MSNAPVIDDAGVQDVARLAEIESLGPHPRWTADGFAEELQRDQARIHVIRDVPGGAVLAFISYWVVAGEVNILNVATHPEHQRRGLARKLLQHVVQQSRDSGCRKLDLDVRRSNAPAIALYQSLGFRSVAVRPSYYPDNREDALLMDLVL